MSFEDELAESKQHYDYLIDHIVRCDDEYCPDLKDLYMDAIFVAMKIKLPEIHDDLIRCTEQNRPDDECGPIFIQGVNRSNPLVYDSVDRHRQATCEDPLQGYDGLKYTSPFWFEGAGDVWRRLAHGSQLVDVKNCQEINKLAEACVLDTSKPQDYCLRLYGHSAICASGVNCSYTQLPAIRCLQKNNDFETINDCLNKVPNFRTCATKFVPQEQVADIAQRTMLDRI